MELTAEATPGSKLVAGEYELITSDPDNYWTQYLQALAIVKQVRLFVTPFADAARREDIDGNFLKHDYILRTSELILWHQPTIENYLNERHLAPELLPHDAQQRAAVRQLTEEIHRWADNPQNFQDHLLDLSEALRITNSNTGYLVADKIYLCDLAAYVWLQLQTEVHIWPAKIAHYYSRMNQLWLKYKRAQQRDYLREVI